MDDHLMRWIELLSDAARNADGDPAAVLRAASDRLCLVWTTEIAVQAATADGELWWLRLAEQVLAAADDLELIPQAPAVAFGTGPAPTGPLPDTPALRRAVHTLLRAVRNALR